MKLDECLEAYRSAERPCWNGEMAIVVVGTVMWLINMTDNPKAPDWKPFEHLDAKDWGPPPFELSNLLRGRRIIGEFCSDAEEERRSHIATSNRYMIDKIRDTFEVRDGALCLRVYRNK